MLTQRGVDVTASKLDSSNRQRKTVRFELNLIDDEQKFIRDILKWWKDQRRMATNVRKAILLFYDLAQGKTDRLREYFPLVVAALTGEAVQDHADVIVERVTDAINDAALSITQQIPAVTLPESSQRALSAQARIVGAALEADGSLIEMSPAKKASSQEVADNFFKSMGNLFS